jgi:hypothetical protein
MKFGKSGCITFVLLLFLLAAFINFLKGPEQTEQPKGNPQTVQQQPAPAANVGLELQGKATQLAVNTLKYSILREWLPNKKPKGLGLEIVLENPEPTEQEIIDLVTQLSNGKNPVSIGIFATQAAYEQTINKSYGVEYKKGFLCVFVKNDSGEGVFQGFNEIRWMQEVGKFSDKAGTVTKLGDTN